MAEQPALSYGGQQSRTHVPVYPDTQPQTLGLLDPRIVGTSTISSVGSGFSVLRYGGPSLWRPFAMAAPRILAMAALRYGGPSDSRYGGPSLWRPLAMADLRYGGPSLWRAVTGGF